MKLITKSWFKLLFEISIILSSFFLFNLSQNAVFVTFENSENLQNEVFTIIPPKSDKYTLKFNLLDEYDTNFYIPTSVRINVNLAIVMTNEELVIINITNILDPLIISNYTIRNDFKYHSNLFIENGFIYLCCLDAGIEIINITNPINPIFVSIYKMKSKASHFTMNKNIISYCKLGIFPKIIFLDVSNPRDIKKASTIKFNGEKGYISNIFIEDIYIYTANNKLNFLNVSNPYSVYQIKSFYLPREFSETYMMDISQKRLFISVYSGGFIVLDITDIIFPFILGQFPASPDSGIFNTNIIAYNNSAILYDSYGSLKIINYTNLLDIMEVVRRPFSCFELQVENNYLFSVCENNRLSIHNLSDILNLPVLSYCQIGSYASSFFIDDKYLYCSHTDRGIEIIKIDENKQLHHINYVTFDCSSNRFYVEDDLLYVASRKKDEYNYVFQIVNISNPYQPIYLCEFSFNNETDFIVYNVIVRNKIVYLRSSLQNKTNHDINDYILILNATDSTNITMLSQTELDNHLDFGLALKEDLLIVSDEGIKIYNISNPENPEYISKITIITNWIRDLYLENNLVYLSLAHNVIPIIDITNPKNPSKESEIIVSDPYKQNQIVYLAINNNLLAVTFQYEEIIFYNVSSFDNVYEINRLEIGLVCRSILLTTDNQLFVANDYKGIKYYQLIRTQKSLTNRNLTIIVSIMLTLLPIFITIIIVAYKKRK